MSIYTYKMNVNNERIELNELVNGNKLKSKTKENDLMQLIMFCFEYLNRETD